MIVSPAEGAPPELGCRRRLKILNDGAHLASGSAGTGLSDLAGRFQELSGTLTHRRLNDDRFQLTAQVPITGFRIDAIRVARQNDWL